MNLNGSVFHSIIGSIYISTVACTLSVLDV